MKTIYRDNKIKWPDTVSGIGFLFALFIIFLIVVVPESGMASIVEYTLTVEKKTVSVTGKPAVAMTINGGLPGPVLRFREGDLARIHVHNEMDEETSIHWHGILLPPEMDGVPFISFYAILQEVYHRIRVPLPDRSHFKSAFDALHPKQMMRILWLPDVTA